MTMQPFHSNPIAQRKADVRRYARNTVVSTGGAVVSLIASLAMGSTLLGVVTVLLLVIAVVSGWKIRQIINHRDEY